MIYHGNALLGYLCKWGLELLNVKKKLENNIIHIWLIFVKYNSTIKFFRKYFQIFSQMLLIFTLIKIFFWKELFSNFDQENQS